MRESETDFRLVECFDPGSDTCTLTPDCRLKGVLGKALKAYFAELDQVTLADIAAPARPPAGRPKAAAKRGPPPAQGKEPRPVIRLAAFKP